jgi:hypothetical protein
MGKINFKQISLLAVLLFLFIGCDLKKAEEAYEKGDYVTAVKYSVKYLDGKKSFPNNKESKKILENLENIVEYYEKNIDMAVNRDSKIKYMSEFWEIRSMVDKKPYNKYIDFFTGKYTVDELGMNVAEQYYIKGEGIKAVKTDDYLKKAEAYETGLTYYNYKDIKEKAGNYRFKYSELKAGEYYTAGILDEKNGRYRSAEQNFLSAYEIYKNYGSYKDSQQRHTINNEKADRAEAEVLYKKGKSQEAAKNYCDAAESFAEADEIYQNHGSYKDSSDLSIKNDKLCKQDTADKYYQDARNREYRANTKREYREIAQIYNSAYMAYQGYGQYKDSYQKYKNLEEKGKVKIYIAGDYDNMLRDTLKSDFIVLTSSYSTADIRVRLVYDDNGYKQGPESQLRGRLVYEVSGYINDNKKYNYVEYNDSRDNLYKKIKSRMRDDVRWESGKLIDRLSEI